MKDVIVESRGEVLKITLKENEIMSVNPCHVVIYDTCLKVSVDDIIDEPRIMDIATVEVLKYANSNKSINQRFNSMIQYGKSIANIDSLTKIVRKTTRKLFSRMIKACINGYKAIIEYSFGYKVHISMIILSAFISSRP